ncbi:unnamed protein product, partial [Mesorhabditis spiculigera]
TLQQTDDSVQITINVSDYKAEELKVSVVGDFIVIEAKHGERTDELGSIERQFTPAWLALVAFAASVVCRWFVSTRKGLLLLHWLVANLLDATWVFRAIETTPAVSLLVPLATIALIFEIATTAGKKEVWCIGSERVLFLVLLFSVDMSVILCAGAAIFEVLLAIFVVLTYLGIYLCLKRVATPHKMTMKERYQLHSSDLFYAWEDPMRCLGLYGRSHFFLILVTLFLQINSYLSSSDFFLDQLHRVGPDLPLHYRKIVTVATPLLFWMFYIGRTFCCFSMLGMPVLIGGQIHALKTFGQWLSQRKARRTAKRLEDGGDDLLANVSA